jgi:hypothetical protein
MRDILKRNNLLKRKVKIASAIRWVKKAGQNVQPNAVGFSTGDQEVIAVVDVVYPDRTVQKFQVKYLPNSNTYVYRVPNDTTGIWRNLPNGLEDLAKGGGLVGDVTLNQSDGTQIQTLPGRYDSNIKQFFYGTDSATSGYTSPFLHDNTEYRSDLRAFRYIDPATGKIHLISEETERPIGTWDTQTDKPVFTPEETQRRAAQQIGEFESRKNQDANAVAEVLNKRRAEKQEIAKQQFIKKDIPAYQQQEADYNTQLQQKQEEYNARQQQVDANISQRDRWESLRKANQHNNIPGGELASDISSSAADDFQEQFGRDFADQESIVAGNKHIVRYKIAKRLGYLENEINRQRGRRHPSTSVRAWQEEAKDLERQLSSGNYDEATLKRLGASRKYVTGVNPQYNPDTPGPQQFVRIQTPSNRVGYRRFTSGNDYNGVAYRKPVDTTPKDFVNELPKPSDSMGPAPVAPKIPETPNGFRTVAGPAGPRVKRDVVSQGIKLPVGPEMPRYVATPKGLPVADTNAEYDELMRFGDQLKKNPNA